MDISDSDDSAFEVRPAVLKRKANSKIGSIKVKQLKLTRIKDDEGNSSLSIKTDLAIQKSILGLQASTSNIVPKDSVVLNCPNNVDMLKPVDNDQVSDHEMAKEESQSMSSYFSKKTQKKDTFSCPLCLKNFDSSTAHVSHMKQCAKKKNMTTQQLLSALELQKKHLLERKNNGLALQPETSRSASVPKNKVMYLLCFLNSVKSYIYCLKLVIASKRNDNLLPKKVYQGLFLQGHIPVILSKQFTTFT